MKSGEKLHMEKRDSQTSYGAILAHVELYRLTIAPVVERLFFLADHNAGDQASVRAAETLDTLVSRGRLLARQFPKVKGATVGETYYVLPAGKSAKEPGDAQTMDFDLQTLWFAALSEQRFHRLSVAETRQLFVTPPHHHVRHVLGDVGDGPFVGRVYPSKVEVKETVARLKQFMSEARTKHALGPWIDDGDYGFCLLADNHRKVEALGEAVMSRRQGAGALADQARILVAYAPTAGIVSQAMSEL